MASTRRRTLDIYQDPDSLDSNPTADRHVEAELLKALGPLNDASDKANIQLKPSTTTRPGSSPSKKDSSPPRPFSEHHRLKSFRLSPPMQPNFKTDSPKKNSGFYTMYQQVAPRPERGLFSQYEAQDKENVFEGASLGELGMPGLYPEHEYSNQGSLKRPFMDAAPLKSAVKKQRLDNEEHFELPSPKDMPAVVDDGQKPPHSYAELIGMAILRAPHRKLTLAQIYKWISENFSFYRSSEGGWQNSIRHNLSLNKNFIKQERPKDDPGKGNYWAIKPGEELPFLLGKKQPVRKAMNPDGSQYVNGLSIPSDPINYRSSTAPMVGNFTLAPNPVRKAESKDIDSAKFPDDTELSSDGTIPASDPALQEDDKDDAFAMPPPPVVLRSSPPPPPHDLGSSPPTFDAQRGGTPPPASRFPPSSRSGGQRRKLTGLNDSGYWSSIESSAARGATHLLASEADFRGHRIKKGRAEAEIARIRSSSFDSPSKDTTRYHGLPAAFGSSPAHRDDHPLTPAVVFKRPAKPPASISPNTNLRDHRNAVRALLGSPSKNFSPIAEANIWSPAFNLGEDAPIGLTPSISPLKQSKTPWRPFSDTANASVHFNGSAFDVFIDAPEENNAARGSPEKRVDRRPSLARAATSTGILADITGTAKSNNLMLAPSGASSFSLSPFLTSSGHLRSPAKLDSPSKHPHKLSTSNPPVPDMGWSNVGTEVENAHTSPQSTTYDGPGLFGLELHSDGSEEGIDIFQDFGKIGQASQMMPVPDRSTGSPVRRSMGPPPRPPLGKRSTSSRW